MKKKKATIQAAHLHPSLWDKNGLKGILRNFAGKKILVVGDVGVDRYTVGTVERISPEAPVPIVQVQEEIFKLGLAANVADNIQALHGTPLLTGVIGRDRAGEDFKKLLGRVGIRASHLVVDSSRRTVLKERIVSERQQLLRVDYENSHGLDREIEAKLLKKIRELVRKVDAVIVEDYAKGLFNKKFAHAVFAEAKKAGKIVAADPNSKTPMDLYRGATILTPNTREAEALSGVRIRDDESLWEAGRILLTETRAQHVVITRGKEGMAIFSVGDPQCRLIPTYAKEVYDVSGAGDTVIAVLTLALSAGASIEEAAVLGNLAAGVEVGKRGTATVSPEEIQVALEFFSNMAV